MGVYTTLLAMLKEPAKSECSDFINNLKLIIGFTQIDWTIL